MSVIVVDSEQAAYALVRVLCECAHGRMMCVLLVDT